MPTMRERERGERNVLDLHVETCMSCVASFLAQFERVSFYLAHSQSWLFFHRIVRRRGAGIIVPYESGPLFSRPKVCRVIIHFRETVNYAGNVMNLLFSASGT